ncbi:transmembrane protein [Mycolicibacterium rhodesiae JS60]|nr:transmembrane protein [Mycolicibacterium rhodesiae JS60]
MLEGQPVEPPERLFFENGASWYWLLAGPASAIAMLLIQFKGGVGFQPVVPLIFLVLVTGFLGLQVKAARIHTSVELTRDALRQGAEVTPLTHIVGVFPEAQHSVKSREPLEKWQHARALGELSGVPRGRTGIGVELTGKRTAQAWARNHRGLRAALTELVGEKTASTQ